MQNAARKFDAQITHNILWATTEQHMILSVVASQSKLYQWLYYIGLGVCCPDMKFVPNAYNKYLMVKVWVKLGTIGKLTRWC